ncbi:kinase-like domain-containing protein [Hygrophoropsis aurantiaca]|uniref:Kinase-like domain-containing protein n=1 Tax=Hygrophoropsis aurantiaca TaxID=72124 RepID=A0ACB8AH10_9AGAM|nr:kinase-like domain-containing protein [Hygrophoropsis aurantiaca]
MQGGDQYKLADLTEKITRKETWASHTGGFADVWQGILNNGDSRQTNVAIKALRPQAENEKERKKKNKRLRRELKAWRGLDHPNIVPLLGVATGFGPYTAMVCPWMENGTLGSYIESHANLTRQAKYKLLYQAARGLEYLHTIQPSPVIHGDITASNVLIDDQHVARLGDFGLSTILLEQQSQSNITSALTGAIRYTAPELYSNGSNNDDTFRTPKPTKESDIYSFGSIMYQVLSGKIPYHHIRSEPQVLIALVGQAKPRHEQSIPDISWQFITECWKDPARLRPTATSVVEHVEYNQYA